MLSGIEVLFSRRDDSLVLKGIEAHHFRDKEKALYFWQEIAEVKRSSLSEREMMARAQRLLERAFASKILYPPLFLSPQEHPPLKLVPLAYSGNAGLRIVWTQSIVHTHNCSENYNYERVVQEMVDAEPLPMSPYGKDQLYEKIFTEWREARERGWVAIQDRC